MKEQKEKRSRFVGLRFTPSEFEQIEQLFKQTTTAEISEFIRRSLFNKPVIIKQRNQSLDDFMTVMIGMRAELKAIGHNFNQSVKQLHTFKEFGGLSHFIKTYEADRERLLNKVEEIQQRINKISELWLQ